MQTQANRTGWKSLRKRGKLEPIENRQLPANLYKMGLPKVRDQEVGGSNPLAPTTVFSMAYILSPFEKVVGSLEMPANK